MSKKNTACLASFECLAQLDELQARLERQFGASIDEDAFPADVARALYRARFAVPGPFPTLEELVLGRWADGSPLPTLCEPVYIEPNA